MFDDFTQARIRDGRLIIDLVVRAPILSRLKKGCSAGHSAKRLFDSCSYCYAWKSLEVDDGRHFHQLNPDFPKERNNINEEGKKY